MLTWSSGPGPSSVSSVCNARGHANPHIFMRPSVGRADTVAAMTEATSYSTAHAVQSLRVEHGAHPLEGGGVYLDVNCQSRGAHLALTGSTFCTQVLAARLHIRATNDWTTTPAIDAIDPVERVLRCASNRATRAMRMLCFHGCGAAGVFCWVGSRQRRDERALAPRVAVSGAQGRSDPTSPSPNSIPLWQL
jgi:hypothetical protein